MHFQIRRRPGSNLLKIHGALDIFTFNDGQDLLKLLPDAPGQNGVIDVLRAANRGPILSLAGGSRGPSKGNK